MIVLEVVEVIVGVMVEVGSGGIHPSEQSTDSKKTQKTPFPVSYMRYMATINN